MLFYKFINKIQHQFILQSKIIKKDQVVVKQVKNPSKKKFNIPMNNLNILFVHGPNNFLDLVMLMKICVGFLVKF
jgi:hypothetical protein